MAVTHHRATRVIELAAAGDNVDLPLRVKSIRVRSASGLAGDLVEVTDTQATPELIWETVVTGSNFVEEAIRETTARHGVRLNTNTGDRATVYIHYE